MCSQLGIRQAYSQAYRAQANGRAERAGRQLLDWLAKMNVDTPINWVEALPRVLQQYHDVIGESGYSPYFTIFGRHRHLAGIPYEPPQNCEDALEFFQRMEEIDNRVAEVLNFKHERMQDTINRNRRPKPPLELGTKVWVYKPVRVGGHRLDSRWWGPATVVARVGESSYEVDYGSDQVQLVHIDNLKVWEEPPARQGREGGDADWGEPLELEYEQREEEEAQEEDRLTPNKILQHRVYNGEFQMLVEYTNSQGREEKWEPANKVYREFPEMWVKFCLGQ